MKEVFPRNSIDTISVSINDFVIALVTSILCYFDDVVAEDLHVC